jgi:iron(III) transport system permease protein
MRRLRWCLRLVLLGLPLVVLVLDPLLGLLRESVEGAGLARYGELPGRPRVREAVGNSLLLSVLTVAGSFLLAVPLAFLLARAGRIGAWLRLGALAPLVMPPVLGTISFHFLCDRGGVLSRLVPGLDWDFRGFSAVLVVHVLSFSAQVLALVAGALERVDPARIEAARTLGARGWRVIRCVLLPEIRPALLAAGILVFLSSMASFTAPFVFGGGQPYLTITIYEAREREPGVAATEAVLLLLLSLAVLALTPRAPVRSLIGSGRRPPLSASRPGSRLLAGAVALPLASAHILPLLTLLLVAFRPRGRLGAGPILEGLGLANFRELLGGPGRELVLAIGRSALYAALSTLAASGLALVLVLGGRSLGPRLGRALLAIGMLPLAIPGTVLGVALIATYATRGPLGLGPGWVGTAALLVLAYLVRTQPLLIQATVAGLARLPTSLPEAARTLGAGPVRTTWRIILPGISPVLIGGALLAFLAAFGEFVASILIATPSTRPAAVAIYEEFRAGLFGPAAAAGILYAVAAAGLAALVTRLPGRRGRPGEPGTTR